jgi:hypothetical protein
MALSDANLIINMLERDYPNHPFHPSNHALQAIIRLLDESLCSKLDTFAETIVRLLQYTDTRKRESFVAALDGAFRRAGHCDTFETVFRTTEYEIYGDAMMAPESLEKGRVG